MPVFYYKALDQQGKTTKGHIDAASEAAVAGSLRSKSLFVLEVTKTTKSQAPEESQNGPNTPSRGTSGNRTLREKYQPISTQERVFFFRQLGVMLRSGLPLLQALDVCKLQGMNPRLVCKIDEMIVGIQKGKSLSQCMNEHRELFPLTAVKLIESGEASGELDQVLERVSEHMEMTAAMKSKLFTSLAYPGIVVFAAIGVGTFLTLTVIPKFTDYFSKRNMDLPASTQLLMNISEFMQDYGFFMFLGLILSIIGLVLLWRRPSSRLILSRHMTKIPIFGKVFEVSAMAQMGQTLSMLLGSGLTVTESLQVAATTTQNASYQNGLALSVNAILRGQSLSESFHKDAFPPLVKQMISVGEQTGELPQALEHMGKFYEGELQARVARMSALIEPVILVLIGGIVGFVYFAFFKAVFQIALAGK
jgi:type IV pilus assembly protein PilC